MKSLKKTFDNPIGKYMMLYGILYTILLIVISGLAIWYHAIGRDWTAVIGGLAVNFITLFIVIGYFEKYQQLIERWYKNEMKEYIAELTKEYHPDKK